MPVPSAAVTTESHAHSRYKSFQSVLLFAVLNQATLTPTSFSTASTVIATILHLQKKAPHFALQKDIAIGFLKATGFRNKPKRTIFGAPCEGTVSQRVRIPPGNCHSSR
jgi:hypothetical protein